mmetsp:Transcript_31908/g.61048  ORF Transcript_31908/g.61048 Transcript_31908/m.61048 type:complete len:389 (+) Transcript_31908:432-1598(+)
MGACNSAPTAAVADTTAAAPHPSPSSNRVNNSACKSGGKCSSNGIRESVMGGTLSSEAGGAPNSTEAKQNIKLDARTAALSPTSPVSTATTISTASPPANIIAVVPPKDDYGPPIQDVSISSNLSTDSSHSSNSSSNNRTKTNMAKHEHLRDLGTSSHRDRSRNRRKSRLLSHTDSRVGLEEIICGDLPNPNLVRIEVPLGKPIEEVYDGVHDGPVLGSGISGIVRLVTHRATQVAYAVKCLDLALIDSEEGLKQLKEEIYIMCQLVRVVVLDCTIPFIYVLSCTWNTYSQIKSYSNSGSSQHRPPRGGLRIPLRNLPRTRSMQGRRALRPPRRATRLPLHRGPVRPPRQTNASLGALHTQQGDHTPGSQVGELFVQRRGGGERVEDD